MAAASASAAAAADDTTCVNTIRAFCADIVQKADSGHPGESPLILRREQ